MTKAEPEKAQRIDKWLWHARVFKTRSLAQKYITSGKIRIDREKTNNSNRQVRPGNVLTITRERDIKILEIVDISERRGPFSQAQLLYKDLSLPKPAPEDKEDRKTGTNNSTPGIEGSGRPTKHQRKQIVTMKRNSTE